jgi:CBS domain-containing protein
MTNRKLAWIVREQNPLTMAADETVQNACRRMKERGVGAVLVVDAQDRLAGIFTGRDAVCAHADCKNAAATTLADVMTRNPDTIAPERTAIEALRIMNDRGFRHLPIVANGRILGIVSRGDFKGLELDRMEDETNLWERIG